MKNKRILSLVLILAIIVAMILPEGVPMYAASDEGTYTFDISEGDITVAAGTGGTLKVTYGGTVTPGGIVVDNISTTSTITIIGTTTTNKVVVDGVTANITLDGVTIQATNMCAFYLSYGANVTLTLTNNNTLKSSGYYFAGLRVGGGQTISIDGSGSLIAEGGDQSAGIGGAYLESSGIINISGGNTNATGGLCGPGIGGGSSALGGSISISGGTVTAAGGAGGAGIGGGVGDGSDETGTGGNISITGGTIIATSDSGAGIGGGYSGVGGTTTISGGTVTATSVNGAGIGGGKWRASGIINISGGTVTATSGSSAGIGNGSSGTGGTGDNITINSSATVMAASGGTLNAIYSGNALLGDANVLMANFTTMQTATVTTAVYNKATSSLVAGFAPTINYKSIAFTVPAGIDTYQIKSNDILQQHATPLSSDFTVAAAGLTTFENVEGVPAVIADLAVVLSPGTAVLSTKATITGTASNRFAVLIDNNTIDPLVGQVLPTGAVVYESGADIKIDINFGRIDKGNIHVYDVDINNKVVGHYTSEIHYSDINFTSPFAGGDGTIVNPYQIETAGQLAYIDSFSMTRDAAAANNFILSNDIDLDLAPYNTGEGWTPVDLQGVFDGNGKTIRNLMINRPDAAGVGLFAIVRHGTIKNLAITNASIVGGQFVGILVGLMLDTHIEQVFVEGNVTGEIYVGGLVGDENISPGTILNCYSTASVSGSGGVGGLVGVTSASSVRKSYASGSVTIVNPDSEMSSYIGGIVGANNPNPDDASVFESAYYDSQVTTQSDTGNGIPKSTLEMKTQATFEGFDFDNVWAISPSVNGGYPYFKSRAIPNQDAASVANATVTVDSIAEQLIPSTDTKITVPIKAAFDKDVMLQKIEYSISYNNTAFAVDEADYLGLNPAITTSGTTSTLKITKTFADTAITAGIDETINFKPIVKATVMAGEQLINVVPKITLVQEGDILELGTAQYPITITNGTVNLVKPPYSSGASMVVANITDAVNIDKTEIPAPTADYSGKAVLVNGQIKLSVPFATFSSLPTSTGSLFGKVTFDENVLTFDSFDGSSSGFTATKTATNELRIIGDCDDTANLNTDLANVVLNFTLKKIPDNFQTEISSSDFVLTEKDGDGNIDISRKDNLAATPKTQTIKFVQKGDPTGEITDNYIKLVLNAATSVGDVNYKTYTYPSLSLTSNKDITGARVYITDGFDPSDKIGYNDIFTNQVVNGITIKVTNGGRIITLTGTASPAVYQDVLSKVSIKLKNTNVERNVVFEAYNPNSTVVVNGTKTNIIPFYNPDNGHLYEYVPNSNVKWTSAVGLAPQRSIGGMTGYLATITDETESGIVAGLCAGQGWLGGSQDMNTLNTLLGKNFTGQGLKYTKDYLNPNMAQGKWFWVTGPEAGQQFYQQNASEASGNLRIPGDNLGMYNNWLPTYEPNNYYNYGENYLHIYPNSGKWNDYMNNQSGIGGYVVEYGGMKDDAPIAISMARVTTNLLNPSDGSSKLEVLFPALPSRVSSGYTVPLYGANSTAYTWEQIAGTSSLTDGYKLMNSSETNRTITIRATGTMPNTLAKTKDYVITVLATKANISSISAPSLSAEGKNAKVALAWAAVDNANYYEVYYKIKSGGTYNTEPIIANGPTTEVLGLTNGTEYTFKIVAAFDSSLKSAASNEVDATPVAPATYLTDIIVKSGGTTYSIAPNFNEGEPNYIVTIPSATTTVDITTTKVGDGTVNGEGNGINVNSPATVAIDSANNAEDKTYTITFIKQYPKLLINYTYQNPTIGNSEGTISIGAMGGSETGYQYSINGGDSWATGFVFTDLAEGSYLLQIKDDAGNLSEIISATLVADGKTLANIGYSPDDLYENGNAQSSDYVIDPGVLEEGTDYTVTYTDMEGRIISEPSLAGTYNMAVTINEDQPNYYGTKMWQFRIIKLEAPSIAIGEVSSIQGYKINDTISYDPEVTYKNGGTNTTETFKWEYSADGLNWTEVSSLKSLTIDANCINKSIRFTVTAYETLDGHDTPTTTVSKTIVLKPATEGGVVIIPTITDVALVHSDNSVIDDSHRARHNGTLKAIVTTTEDTSSVIDEDSGYDYKWYRAGELIDGATAQNYILNKEDVGKIISVKAAIRTDYSSVAESDYMASNAEDVYADLNMSPNLSVTSNDKKFLVGDKITVNLAASKYYENVVASSITSLKYGVASSDSESPAVTLDKDLATDATSFVYTIKTTDANKRYILFKTQATETTIGEAIVVKTCILRIDTLTGIATNWAYKLDYIVTDNANFNSYKVYQIITNIGSNNTAKITVDTAKVAGDAKAKMYYSSERGKYVVVMPANITPDIDKFIVEDGSTDELFYGKQDNIDGVLNADDINKSIQVWLKKDFNADNTNLIITEVAGDGVIDPNDAAQIASAILADKKAGKLGILSR